jgi:hypothetical protein
VSLEPQKSGRSRASVFSRPFDNCCCPAHRCDIDNAALSQINSGVFELWQACSHPAAAAAVFLYICRAYACMVLFQQRAQLGLAAKQTSHACRGGVSQPKCKPSSTNDMQTVCPEAPTPSPPADRDWLIHDCILRTGSFKQRTLHTRKLAHRHHNTKKHSTAQRSTTHCSAASCM